MPPEERQAAYRRAYVQVEQGPCVVCYGAPELAIHEGDLFVIKVDRVLEGGRVARIETVEGVAAPADRGNSVVRHVGETYEGLVLVGGFSKAYSSLLAFIACPTELKQLLKVAAPPYLYSGPSPVASLATVLAGFAPDGPEQCSGLPVQRHTTESLAEALTPTFTPVDFTPECHLTPAGVAQSFLYATYRPP